MVRDQLRVRNFTTDQNLENYMTRIHSSDPSAGIHTPTTPEPSASTTSGASSSGHARQRAGVTQGALGQLKQVGQKRTASSGSTETAPRKRLAQQRTAFFDDGSSRVETWAVPDLRRGAMPEAHAMSEALRNPPELIHLEDGANPKGLASTDDPKAKSWASDSHFHPTNYAQQGMLPRDMVNMMNDIGVRRTVMAPIPTDCMPCGSHAHGEHNDIPSESYYIPARHKDIKPEELTADVEKGIAASGHVMLNQQVDADTAFFFKSAKLSDAERDRIDPMVTGVHLGSPLSTQALLFKMAKDPGVFSGIGEVTIHKELIEHQYEGVRQANLTTNVQAFKNLAASAGVIGMPVVLHCDVDSTENQRKSHPDPAVHFNDLKNLFASPETSNTHIIWAHGGGLGRFVKEPSEHVEKLGAILSNPAMKHVNIDISWSRVAQQVTKDEASLQRWSALINEHPTRFLFGSDALNPQTNATWSETADLYKPLFNRLTPEANTLVKTGNYDRLITQARPKVRAFEKHVLTQDFVEKKLRASGNTRLNDGPHIDASALRAARDEAFAKAGVGLDGHPVAVGAH
jgi:hypothetical protein